MAEARLSGRRPYGVVAETEEAIDVRLDGMPLAAFELAKLGRPAADGLMGVLTLEGVAVEG
jgi:hypothetical protein